MTTVKIPTVKILYSSLIVICSVFIISIIFTCTRGSRVSEDSAALSLIVSQIKYILLKVTFSVKLYTRFIAIVRRNTLSPSLRSEY